MWLHHAKLCSMHGLLLLHHPMLGMLHAMCLREPHAWQQTTQQPLK
jgi:hypothetical protein